MRVGDRWSGTAVSALGIAALAALAAGTVAGGAAAPLDAALDAPGDEIVLTLAAMGVQIYECRTDAAGTLAWAFTEPHAELFAEGRPVGRHFAGPAWEYRDGSSIVGKPVARQEAPEPGAIPWLRVAVVSHAGSGVLGPVSVVKRIETHGGTLSGSCPRAGETAQVPYTAEYVMIRAAAIPRAP